MDKPVIAITMGDPAGIGPELVVKILATGMAYKHCRPFIIGDPEVMEGARRLLGAELRFREIERLSEAAFAPPVIDILCPPEARNVQVSLGKVSAIAGKAAMVCLLRAFDLAMEGSVRGVVSAPLNKEAFHLAGFHYRDELQCLADYTKSREAFTMGVANSIWTVAVSEHVPFRGIADLITQTRVLAYINRMDGALRKAGFAEPRIAVAALNPHGGEGGILGREELDEIAPAITAARRQGINAQGPVAADAVFWKALAGSYDGVVFMYHDQANIARKLQPMDKGATIFMGLPVACATTAHGTAFDIVGKGIANTGSLEAALRYTAQLA
jgi:4-hydroxythreonine-4-phosphate dehydrogenase